MSALPPPNWHPDPFNRFEFRYWDGAEWTHHVAASGRQGTDPPLWTAPPSPAARHEESQQTIGVGSTSTARQRSRARRQRFTDPRASALNAESALIDTGMRSALVDALEPDEEARAAYSVSGHIWVWAFLTDRALLIVKGATRTQVIRVSLPLQVVRQPTMTRQSIRVMTPLGAKNLWGSKIDRDLRLLAAASEATPGTNILRSPTVNTAVSPLHASQTPPLAAAGPSTVRQLRRDVRRAAGKKPRRPRLKSARKPWVGFPPPSQIWEMAHNCIKCGRPLTNPRSQRARVGTTCIKRWGPQPRKIPNPAYSAWLDRKTRADVAYIADQVAFEAAHRDAVATYEEALAEWKLRRGKA